jgi:hypothetical protein
VETSRSWLDDTTMIKAYIWTTSHVISTRFPILVKTDLFNGFES